WRSWSRFSSPRQASPPSRSPPSSTAPTRASTPRTVPAARRGVAAAVAGS
ncbi:MAG: hypothetical protein AVDCRST_MAG53-957, partial [uncultured Solirubrobacteraceae bacterium]